MSDVVAIYDVDSADLPNLALMKIVRAELERGSTVVRYDPLFRSTYNKVYASKIFSFSDGAHLDPAQMEIGGSGWQLDKALPAEIEALQPDYSLYPDFKGNLGFTMRGCRLACRFCVVRAKEGPARPVATIPDLLVQDSDFLVLLDNDFFGNPEWRDRVAEIWRHDLTVNLSQGINVRNITDEQARALAQLVNAAGGSRLTNLHRTRGQFHFAWDNPRDERQVLAGIRRLDQAGIARWRMACYVLIGFGTSPAEDEHRVQVLRQADIDPFVMPFNRDDPYQADFARWVNHKATFNAVRQFADYSRGVRYRAKQAAAEEQPRLL